MSFVQKNRPQLSQDMRITPPHIFANLILHLQYSAARIQQQNYTRENGRFQMERNCRGNSTLPLGAHTLYMAGRPSGDDIMTAPNPGLASDKCRPSLQGLAWLISTLQKLLAPAAGRQPGNGTGSEGGRGRTLPRGGFRPFHLCEWGKRRAAPVSNKWQLPSNGRWMWSHREVRESQQPPLQGVSSRKPGKALTFSLVPGNVLLSEDQGYQSEEPPFSWMPDRATGGE